MSGALDDLAAYGFTQIDLDDLLQGKPLLAARKGLACVGRAVDVLPDGVDADVLLTLPLEQEGAWPGVVPTMTGLLREPWNYGPGRAVPGLYLVTAAHWRAVELFEDYRQPLKGDDLPAGLVAYYRAWREVGDSEFDRCVYVRSAH